MTPIEAAYSGCPPLMSDIPAHRTIAAALFGDGAHEFLFPVGDVAALGHLMRDEIQTGRLAHPFDPGSAMSERWSRPAGPRP